LKDVGDEGPFVVEVSGPTQSLVELKRQPGERKLVKQSLASGVAYADFYLAFRIEEDAAAAK
jgi:hypothetical protein